MAKKMKMDLKKIAKNAVVTAGTGVAAQIAAEAINITDKSVIDYAYMGVGVLLPEIVSGDTFDTIGTSLLAVGAYRMSERQKLASKMGIATVSGIGASRPVIGAGWRPTRTVYASASGTQKKNKTVE